MRNEKYLSSEISIENIENHESFETILDLQNTNDFNSVVTSPVLMYGNNLKKVEYNLSHSSSVVGNTWNSVMAMKNKNLFNDIKSLMCMNYITNGGVDFFNNYFTNSVTCN